jgi:hypothetical protein
MHRGCKAFKTETGSGIEDNEDEEKKLKSRELKVFNEIRELVFRQYIHIWREEQIREVEEEYDDDDEKEKLMSEIKKEAKYYLNKDLTTYNFLEKIDKDEQSEFLGEDVDQKLFIMKISDLLNEWKKHRHDGYLRHEAEI